MSNTALAVVLNTISVNVYCVATFKVKANSARDAAVIAVNSPIQWKFNCEQYNVTWWENDAMMIDVDAADGSSSDEFEYASVQNAGGKLPKVNDDAKFFEVNVYFNLEVEVNDAEDDEDAIAKADNADITGEPITALDVTWWFSESLESDVIEQ